jgi:gluconolactonase
MPEATLETGELSPREGEGALMAEGGIAPILDGPLEQMATGFGHAEGPLWHPDGYWLFNDVTKGLLYRFVPGTAAALVREDTGGGSGMTFDLEGHLIVCEGSRRRVSRLVGDRPTVIAERFEGKRLQRPNDVVCRSDGGLYFTDRGLRVPLKSRELLDSGVYCLAPDGTLSFVAQCEDPNGLAFTADERTLIVANSRWTRYLLALELDGGGSILRRRIFADMSSDDHDGVPDGVKIDAEGRVYCAAAGGIWVFDAEGGKLAVIPTPEVPTNLAFGGEDLRTLMITGRTSLYLARMRTPGLRHPWYAERQVTLPTRDVPGSAAS